MTDKQIETRIAESLGWVNIQSEQFTGTLKGYPPKRHTYEYVPHYTNDLNAMHEAEKALKWEQRRQYHNTLAVVSGFSYCEADSAEDATVSWNCRICHATARERAEAFLRTLNLWEDGE